MNARDIMQPHVITTDRWTAASQVAIQMTVGRISGLPVTDLDNALVGIITEFDLIGAVRAGKDLDAVQVDELMTRDVIAIDSDATVDAVIEVLQRERIIRLPVVSDGVLVGIVSRGDVLKAALGPKLSLFGREIAWPGSAS